MKRPISPAYTFAPGSSTLNLSGIAGFNIGNLFAVIDLATGALLYAPLPNYGYSALAGTTLTLEASMAGLNATDPLMILYDDGGKPAEDGIDITGAVMPAGGSGIRGWESASYTLLKTGAPAAPRNAVAGTLANSGDTVVVPVDSFNSAILQLGTGWTGGPAVFEASADGGTTWIAVNMVPYAGGTPINSVTAGGLWEMACGGLTHLRVRATAAITAGGPVPVVAAAASGLKSLRVGSVDGGIVTLGSTGDAAAASDTGAASLMALIKRGLSRWTTLFGLLPVSLGQKAMAGSFPVALASDQGPLPTQPFTPIAGATVALTAGPAATTAPLALPANVAASYRVRNPLSSASAVTWKLQTVTPGTAPVIPTAYSTGGTGGTAGDKTLDPGGVEIIGLSAAQQAALAAGTLYLSAITPAGGSAILYITPGSGN